MSGHDLNTLLAIVVLGLLAGATVAFCLAIGLGQKHKGRD